MAFDEIYNAHVISCIQEKTLVSRGKQHVTIFRFQLSKIFRFQPSQILHTIILSHYIKKKNAEMFTVKKIIKNKLIKCNIFDKALFLLPIK